MSIYYTPAFLIAHLIASPLGYPTDGYSLPYQFALFFQGLLVTFIGFYYLRRFLLQYFKDEFVAWTILIIGLCTNLLEYGAITNAMSHNYLFAGYAILLWNTFKIYHTNKWKYYIGSAFLIGTMALARPTEIIAVLIPIIFLTFSNRGQLFVFLKSNFLKIITVGIIIGLIGSIQILYWLYVSGEFVQYSYQDQGFSWLHPHIKDGLFSFKAGWLIYTPVMILSLIGFLIYTKKYKEWYFATIIFSLLFIYIAFAWDIWWYGGSLGQRTMIQIYPVLAIPIILLLSKLQNYIIKTTIFLFIGICGFLNVWLIHQAHLGGFFIPEEMNKGYYYSIVGQRSPNKNVVKLLDCNYIHDQPIVKEVILQSEQDTTCLNGETQSIPPKIINLNESHQTIRWYVNYQINEVEWEKWRWTQLIIQFKKGDELLQTDMLRIQRLNNFIGDHTVYLDALKPIGATSMEYSVWHADSQKSLCVNSSKILHIQ